MIQKAGEVLVSLDGWKRFASPKSDSHWKTGRSAKEAARAWTSSLPDLPTELSALLASHSDFAPLLEWTAEPEARTRFDDLGGEPANIDVLVHGSDEFGLVVIGVEAKADEPFGRTLASQIRSAEKALSENPRSKALTRINQLAKTILGLDPDELSSAVGIRYQLLTLTAAVVAEARRTGARRGVAVVQEFVTDRTTDERHLANLKDLQAFLSWIKPGHSLEPGLLLGPIARPGGPRPDGEVQLYFGKVVRELRGQGTSDEP